MAIKKTELYSSLWQSCDELRGGMDASQYKDYVLVMLFVKYVSDKYAGQPYAKIVVPQGGGFADMVALKGDKEIGDKMNKIIGALAEANNLKGVIDVADFNDAEKLGKGKEMQERLSNLVAIFDNPDLNFRQNRAEGDDLLGDAYEYLMRHFTTESGKSKGQFYTPAEVSRVMARVIGTSKATSQSQTIYDPTAGQFTSADTVADGLNRYGYVAGNPTTNTDPTGHLLVGSDGGPSGPYIIGSILETFQPQKVGRDPTNFAAIYKVYGRYIWLWSNGTRTYSNSLMTIRTYESCDAVCIRDRSLESQAKGRRLLGAIAIAIGTFVDVFADIAGIMYGKSITEKLEDALDAGLTIISLAPLIALLNASLSAGINFVLAGAHAVIALVRSALAALNKWGPLATAAANVAVNTATTLVGGPVGVLQRALMAAAGPVVNNLLSAGAHALIAFGYYQLGVAQQLIDQEIKY